MNTDMQSLSLAQICAANTTDIHTYVRGAYIPR